MRARTCSIERGGQPRQQQRTLGLETAGKLFLAQYVKATKERDSSESNSGSSRPAPKSHARGPRRRRRAPPRCCSRRRLGSSSVSYSPKSSTRNQEPSPSQPTISTCFASAGVEADADEERDSTAAQSVAAAQARLVARRSIETIKRDANKTVVDIGARETRPGRGGLAE